ncbi:MAG: cyclic nucleotide-binding domain-containing protein [Anaerolineae bacterium]
MNRPDTRNVIARCLQSQPLFAGLSAADLAAVAAIAFLQDAPAGKCLWAQGSPGDRYFLVLRGQLEARCVDAEGQEEVLARMGPGASLGETSLLLGDPHDATVTAISPARLLAIPRPEFLALLRQRPSLATSLQPREDICQALESPRFSWQDGNERVVLYVLRHPWVLWRRLLWPLLALAALAPVARYLQLTLPLWLLPGTLVLLWALWLWLEWRNDYLIVTTRRLVHVEKQLLFYERQQQAPLDKIQDVSVVHSGLAAAIFGLGHLTVQTAGASGQIIFTYAPQPEAIKETVFAEVGRYRALQRANRRQMLEAELRRQLGLTSPPEAGTGEQPPQPAWQPQGPIDTVALRLTELIRKGFPRLRQQQGEVIMWRKHWLVLLRDLGWPLLLGIAFVTLPIVTGFTVPWPAQASMAAIVLLWLWWQWENWRNDVYILTPDRIIDIERIPLRLRSTRREGSLLNIQNVTYVIPGLLAGLLNYGNVTIETAGQVGNFTFEAVYDPSGVQADIFRYAESFRARQQQAEESEQRQALADLLAAYERLREEMGKRG